MRFYLPLIVISGILLLSCNKPEAEYQQLPQPKDVETTLWKKHEGSFIPKEKVFNIKTYSANNEIVVLSHKTFHFLDKDFKEVNQSNYASLNYRGLDNVKNILPFFYTNAYNHSDGKNYLNEYALNYNKREAYYMGLVSPSRFVNYNQESLCFIADQYPDYYNNELPISLYSIYNKDPDKSVDMVLTRKGKFSGDTLNYVIKNSNSYSSVLSNKIGYLVFNAGSNRYAIINPTLNNHYMHQFNEGTFNKILATNDAFYLDIYNKTYLVNESGEPKEIAKLRDLRMIGVFDKEHLVVMDYPGFAIFNTTTQELNYLPQSALLENHQWAEVINNNIVVLTDKGIFTYLLK